ncbi:MAG: amidohydrolase [Bacillota bacterium]|nr:amidohydrolase [Bacillota bacterium]NLV70402.1 amidohydrolase [Clostridiales bacterium]
MKIKKEIEAIRPEVIELRRDFHRHPELGFKEFRTSGIVKDYLESLDLDEVHTCSGTGVIGILKGGKPGKRVILRADIDALPIQEDSGEPFASENPGIAHACGHDGHTAMLLGAAKIWAAHRAEIPGTLVFLFQPNEEDAGAQIMIDDGAMEITGKPDAIFGYHLWANFPLGKIGIHPGPTMASSYYFKIKIHGKGGHGGEPHGAINPIDAATYVLSAIKSFHTLEQDVFQPTVITCCMIHAGQKEIIVPDDLEMEGSIRCLHEGHEAVHARFREMVEQACALCRCTCEIELKCGNSLLNNDEALTALALETAETLVGPEHVVTKNVAMMGGDDFAEFLQYGPGFYFFIGMGDPAKGTDAHHHNAKFKVNEEALPIGIEMLMNLVSDYLKR